MSSRSWSTPATTSCGMPARAYCRRGSPGRLRALATAVSSVPARGAGTTNIFSGTIRPARHEPMPTSVWLESTSLIVAPCSAWGRLAGFTCWPRAVATSSSSVRSATGIDSRPTSIGSMRPANAAGPLAAAFLTTSRSRAASRRNGPLRVLVRAPRYAPQPSRSPRSRASDRMYVPAPHSTSTTAVGRSGSEPSHWTSSRLWIVTDRAARSTGWP